MRQSDSPSDGNDTMTKWTEAEDEIIRKRRAARVTVPEIAAELGRGTPATYARARKLDTRVMDRNEWTAAGVKRLETLYKGGMAIDAIAAALDRTVNSVRWKLDEGGITLDRVKTWTADEDAILTEMAAGKTARSLDFRLVVADLLNRVGTNRTVVAVEGRVRALGLLEASRTAWTDKEIEALKGALADLDGFAIAHGKDRAAVDRKVRALGLSRVKDGIDVEPELIAAAATRKGGLAELADRLDVPVRSLRAHGQKVGVIGKRASRLMTEEKRQRILEAAAVGMSVTDAMRALGHDVRVLNKVAEEAGVSFAKGTSKPRPIRPRAPAPARLAKPRAATKVLRRPDPRLKSKPQAIRAPDMRDVRPDVASQAARFAAWRSKRAEGEALV